MSEFFGFDPTKLDTLLADDANYLGNCAHPIHHEFLANDVKNHMGTCTHPDQAVRCVLLAHDTGAISWDKAQWPDLALGWWRTPRWPDRGFGVNDAPPPTEEGDPEFRDDDQIQPWLHMRRTWPTLSGESFSWYSAVHQHDGGGTRQRVHDTVELAVQQLNRLHSTIKPMVREHASLI
ncbi:hypothetical protein JWS13_04230 (plasmid) [Rhodococcus pseudokoreensis]|uniref:HD domain-containing protein n=1 Tax=Rhodococcus pseudokoreensis TaxID=2811421 RepID=A0A974ZRV3_9NOCA|nr:hypothetical protein [Rhodococcus pseudokoreensis]QSE87924.1 hypothetical protein JWS13_04230 [Rhodococcus pseudokoreensis]